MATLEMIECRICGEMVLLMEQHLKDAHDGFSLQEYLDSFPGAPICSTTALPELAATKERISRVKVDVSVADAFGVDMPMKTVQGFEKPRKTTPDVDPYYVFTKKNLAICLYAMMTGSDRVLFSGPTGAGKSSIVEQVAARLNWGFCRLNLDEDISRADLIGQWVLKGKEMVFQYGLLPTAMMEGDVLCLDEWDFVNPGVGMLLQPVLEGKALVIPETGETIMPSPDFRVFATANTIGQGDPTGLYNGAQAQNFAQLDRFSMVGIVDYPPREAEKKILLLKAGVGEEVAEDLLDVAEYVRNAFMKNETMATLSTRTVVNIAQKQIAFGVVREAYEIGFLNKLNPDDRVFVSEVIQRVYGSKAA
jgi:cobaltochelatase CobS